MTRINQRDDDAYYDAYDEDIVAGRVKPVRTAPPLQTADAGLPKPSGSSGRRTILEQELANEQQALASAQNELSAARAQKNQNRASQLTANIQDRRQNIQALQRELSRM